MSKNQESTSKHTPGPCRRKNRGGLCRSSIYTFSKDGEPTCFYHARVEEIVDADKREAEMLDRALLARLDGGK